MTAEEWVISSANEVTHGKKNLIDISKLFSGYNAYTVLACRRISQRGKIEEIYIVGAGYGYGDIKTIHNYINETNNGLGGRGKCVIEGVARCAYGNIVDFSSRDVFLVNKPVYIFK